MPSLKPLKSVAHNIGAQFGSTLTYWDGDYGINHLARATNAVGGAVIINFLSETSEPQLAGEGIQAIRELAKNLPALLAKAGFVHDLLANATATYRFHGPNPSPGGCVKYNCRVELVTKEGRTYAAELSELNAP